MPDNGNQPATKADVHAVRNELKAVHGELKAEIQKVAADVSKVAMELARTQGRMETMEDRLGCLISDGNRKVMKMVGDFAADAQKIDRRHLITSHRVDELEKRVKVLESSRPTAR
ncbi:MAG: hypothetical protein HY922_08930 [Elusimicrobia bacterium]|nr:hypothetical protein [Elusimicrobiota bacterium]